MKVLLDTNAYSAMRRGERWIIGKVQNAEKVSMSAIVVGELLFGFHNGTRFQQNFEKLRAFLAQPEVEFLSVTWTTAQHFGQIAAALRQKGRPIPTNDIWIAAQALETGAVLLSADRHFDEVDGLPREAPQ